MQGGSDALERDDLEALVKRAQEGDSRSLAAIYEHCCQSAKVGHFETREGYCYEECRASSLRVLL